MRKIVQKNVWKSKKLAHLEKISMDGVPGVPRFFHLWGRVAQVKETKPCHYLDVPRRCLATCDRHEHGLEKNQHQRRPNWQGVQGQTGGGQDLSPEEPETTVEGESVLAEHHLEKTAHDAPEEGKEKKRRPSSPNGPPPPRLTTRPHLFRANTIKLVDKTLATQWKRLLPGSLPPRGILLRSRLPRSLTLKSSLMYQFNVRNQVIFFYL